MDGGLPSSPIRTDRSVVERVLVGSYDTIRYDSVYLTCSKMLSSSQLSLSQGINKNKNVN